MDREAVNLRHPVLLVKSGSSPTCGKSRSSCCLGSPLPRKNPGRNRVAIAWSVLSCELFFILSTAGCGDSEPGQRVHDSSAQPAASPAPASPVSAVAAPSVSKASVSGAQFHPVVLDPFYQRQFVDYRPTESWAQVPRGETNLDGVPFLMFGKIDLTGLGRARDGEFQPARVGEVPVGRRATQVHLIHGASYDSPHDTPIACVLLRYESGEVQRLFIRYGVHARNWYVEARETDPALSDPRSLVIWNGTTRPDGSGTATRLFKTTFDNPLPAQEIRAIELLSLFARANSVILAITLEDSPGAPPPPMEDNDDSEFRRQDSLRVLDTDSGQPIPSATIRLSVTEGARTYRFGAYQSDGNGQVRIDYPPGRFQAFIVDATAPGYSPLNFEILNEDGFLGSDMPVRLKREPAPPPNR